MEEELRLASVYCRLQPKRHIAVIGLPGTGKWTIGQRLSRQYCWCHIDSSRHHNAEDYIERELKSYRCSQGAVITAYPHNTHQSNQLQAMMSRQGKAVDKVIELGADLEEVLEGRVVGRVVHEASGTRYTTSPHIGEGLVCRLADSPQGFQSRWEEYDSKAISHHLPVLTVPTAGKSIEEVWQSVESSLF